ncbi:helix-turn-helix transcriptional regulator [Listeria ivanovii]|uniref:Helix-turn-helix transcriptional regulator n=2 Tax=Listeria ivanovii TaxID=1638 RepID=A0ABS1G0Z4_LISIV|nr:AraC family transcriptional regulator [Listeria ivanovii]AIS59578.1 AraC family transcriptional regulator [Listeria ivanovii subsp. londoniensis]AIS62410.1 AraC family transcriptional regulator [Listeria ivanovii subsp. londoniensis]MBC2253957.1 helix-turn-helix transcriptional regulator [Listeria ivanovii]MBK1960549.1 helix-turn-helix transcriptional regulator [Listeria ivanovii subsp. londoniensis]MBK1965196.1 helix-turn-helix transcriptional regulator [Listeria ivanovii subsp. londoniens
MEKEKIINIQPVMLNQVENQFTEQIQADFNQKNPDHSALLHSLETVEVLDVLSDYYMAHEKQKEPKKEVASSNKVGGEHKEIKQAIRFIKKNIHRSITLEEVANYVYLSPFYLSKLFKNELNINFINYVNEQKMLYAKDQLEKSDWAVHTIAKNLGFSRASYFCKVFKKTFDMTPKEYRDSLK